MKSLALDSTTASLSLAILEREDVLAEKNIPAALNHSQYIFPEMEKLFRKSKTKLSELSFLAVNNGPGSFTGIRVGLTVAKTLAQCLKIPLISFSSLDILAFRCLPWAGCICPLIDALRREIYSAVYLNDKKISDYYLGDFSGLLGKEKALLEKDGLLFTGPAAVIHQKEIEKQFAGKKISFADSRLSLPRAPVLGLMAYRRFLAEKISKNSYREVLPLYIRRPYAEEKRLI
ncbi:MAG: tRNA (adenosine(37)-N6)-threonylcarbamoyltransferase complex dimerization subunit type 1 TsaB [Elusimicrobiota bacterium]